MEKEVNFLIIGSGPIGLTLTTLISESRVKDIGQKVILKVRSNCAELKEKGIALEFGDKVYSNRPVVIDNLNLNVSIPRLVVITTKTYDLPVVLKELAGNRIKCQAFFLPINGIDSHDEDLEKFIAKKFPGVPIISGSITLPVEKTAPNTARVTNTKGGIALAKYKEVDGAEETLRLLETIFTNSGVKVKVCDNYEHMRWSKMLLNMLGNGVGAILNRSADQIFSNPMTANIERGCIREFFQVIDHPNKKIKLVDLPGYKAKKLNSLRLLCAWWMPLCVFRWKMHNSVGKARGDKLPSLHFDLEVLKRTATEILNYNGGIAYAAKKLGIKTPYNSIVVQVLQSISPDYCDNPYREESGPGLLWSKVQRALGK